MGISLPGGNDNALIHGDTISPELANYCDNCFDAEGLKKICRQQTTQVGVFPANPWINQLKNKIRADIGARASDWWWLA